MSDDLMLDEDASCSIGGVEDDDVNIGDAEAMQTLKALDKEFCPSPPQKRLMMSLCQQLHLNFAEVTKNLNNNAAYSAKITDLVGVRQAAVKATCNEITPAQVQFLMTQGVDKEVIRRLTKQQASDMITKKLAERDAQPPTGPQLQLLTDLKYAGCTPATKNKASEIIRSIRLAKRVKFLKEKARRKGTSPAVVEKLIALVMKYDL